MESLLPTDLRTVLRASISQHNDLILAAAEPVPRSPGFSKLIQAVRFTRRFTPTYLAVVAAVILVFAVIRSVAIYRGRNLPHWHPHKDVDGHDDLTRSPSSSSSSTLNDAGSRSPPPKENLPVSTETSPLLNSSPSSHPPPSSDHTLPHRIWSRLRSILLYQPAPIRVTDLPRVLPANQITCSILALYALNLFYLFYATPLSRPMVFAFADRAGLLFAVNLPLIYLLAAKNNQPLLLLTGWSYEGLNIFHRRVSELITVIAAVHVSGMVVVWYDLLRPAGLSLAWYLTRGIIVYGMIAWWTYVLIALTSTSRFRRWMYEGFLVGHIVLQVLGLVMLFLHHGGARPYVLASLGIWVLDRAVSRLGIKRQGVVADLSIAEDGETVVLVAEIDVKRSWWRLRSAGVRGGWKAGQHVFLTVPGIHAKHAWQAHPFTIAGPAPPTESGGKWPLQLTIRAQDGFSRDLLGFARHHQHARVFLDGPYGSDDVVRDLRRADRVCLIAGGSGIAVTYPLAWERLHRLDNEQCVVQNRTRYIDGRKHKPKIVRSTSDIDHQRYAHFWVRQEENHDDWIKMLPSLHTYRLPDVDAELSVEVGDLITDRFETRDKLGHRKQSRPDMAFELRSWVQQSDRKRPAEIDRETVCVVVSGPDGLVRDVQNAVAGLARDGWKIEIHVEKFGW